MGQLLKNKTTFELSDNLTDFFSLPTLEEPTEDYEKLKNKIYRLKNIEPEEQADIIGKINSLKKSCPDYEKNKIKKSIDEFCKKYNLQY